jgi:signal transduction histidine kinase
MIFSASENNIVPGAAGACGAPPSSPIRFYSAVCAFVARLLAAIRRVTLHHPSATLALILFASAAPAHAMTQLENAYASFELEAGAPVRVPSTVNLPFSWDRDIGGISGKGRFTMRFTADPNGPQQALFIRRVGNAFEATINGQTIARVGSFGDRYFDSSASPRLLLIPPSLLRDQNVVTITIGAMASRNGGLGVVYSGTAEELQEMYEASLRWRNSSFGVLLVISIILGSFTMLLWLRERDSLYLYYAASELLWAVHIASVQIETAPFPGILWVILNYSCYAVSAGFICKFSLTLVGRQSGTLKRIVGLQLWLSVPVIIFAVLSGHPVLVSIWFGITVLLGTVVAGVVIRQALRVRSVEQRVLAAAVCLTAAAAVHDMVVFRILTGYGGFPLLAFAWTALGMAMAWIIADRLHKSTVSVSRMNRNLGQRLAEQEQVLERLFDSRAARDRRDAIVEERQRIMRDMHDGLGSQLVSAVRLVRDPNVPRSMLTEQLQDALDHLKMTVDAMQDTDGDIAMLLGALRYRLAPRLQAIGVNLSWDVRTLPPVEDWSIEKSRHLQLILFEAISNLIAHSGASQAHLSAEVCGDNGEEVIRITLRDNGVGLRASPTPGAGGHGLANIRSRAASIGAVLCMNSSESGTELMLEVAVGGGVAESLPGADEGRASLDARS